MKEIIKEVKDLLKNGKMTREELLLELFTDNEGNLVLSSLDFRDFDGDVSLTHFKVKGNLNQGHHKVEGDLYQDYQKVKGNLIQSYHKVEGRLYQGNHEIKKSLTQGYHKVEGDYYAVNIRVKGEINFEEPSKMLKKITLEELKEMGYELEE